VTAAWSSDPVLADEVHHDFRELVQVDRLGQQPLQAGPGPLSEGDLNRIALKRALEQRFPKPWFFMQLPEAKTVKNAGHAPDLVLGGDPCGAETSSNCRTWATTRQLVEPP